MSLRDHPFSEYATFYFPQNFVHCRVTNVSFSECFAYVLLNEWSLVDIRIWILMSGGGS